MKASEVKPGMTVAFPGGDTKGGTVKQVYQYPEVDSVSFVMERDINTIRAVLVPANREVEVK